MPFVSFFLILLEHRAFGYGVEAVETCMMTARVVVSHHQLSKHFAFIR